MTHDGLIIYRLTDSAFFEYTEPFASLVVLHCHTLATI